MNRLLSGALAAALALSVVLLPVEAAHSERWSAPDAEGNVAGWRLDPEPEPCGTMTEVDASDQANADITRLSVQHGRHRVRVVVSFRDLDETLEQFVSIHLAVPEVRGWAFDVDRIKVRGRFEVWAMFYRELREPTPDELDECGSWGSIVGGGGCRTTASFDFTADKLRATVPRRCLRDPEWVQVGAGSYGWAEDAGNWSYGGFDDEWGVREEGASPWLPPLGPRIRVS